MRAAFLRLLLRGEKHYKNVIMQLKNHVVQKKNPMIT